MTVGPAVVEAKVTNNLLPAWMAIEKFEYNVRLGEDDNVLHALSRVSRYSAPAARLAKREHRQAGR